MEEEVLNESDDHLSIGEIPEHVLVDLTNFERLDTSSSHLSSLPACRLAGSSTSEAIS